MTTIVSPAIVALRANAHHPADAAARRSAARDALNCARLPAGVGEALDAAHALHVARRAARRSTPHTTLEQRLVARTVAAVTHALAGNYRVAESAWAGGEHSTTVLVDDSRAVDAHGTTNRVWSGNWSGNNSVHHIVVRRDWLRTVHRPGLAEVDGLATLSAVEVEPGVWDAAWVAQGRGVGLRVARGVIVREAGDTCHGGTVAGARRTLRARRAERTASQRLAQLGGADLDAVVTIGDSEAAGNCATGTASFVARYFPGRTSATVREILGAAEGGPQYNRALAACHVAIRRAIKRAA